MWRANKRKIVGVIVALAAVATIVTVSGAFGRGDAPDVPTTAVTKGEFVDYMQVRGEVKAVRSIPLTAPLFGRRPPDPRVGAERDHRQKG